MTFWDWLVTPGGVEAAHAFIGLMIAITGWVAYSSHEQIKKARDELRNHVEQHQVDDALRGNPE